MITELILTFHAKGFSVEKIAEYFPHWLKDILNQDEIVAMITTCIDEAEKEAL